METKHKVEYTKTETSLIIYLIVMTIIMFMFMMAFHSVLAENEELKIKILKYENRTQSKI